MKITSLQTIFFAMASLCCSSHANAQTLEPLEASSGAYTDAAIDRFLEDHDKDGNGKFEKAAVKKSRKQ